MVLQLLLVFFAIGLKIVAIITFFIDHCSNVHYDQNI